MVYGGKPSTGCRNCRQRHIKCDETRPHCRACMRTKRSCPGYPDPFDVMLRDHTPSFRKPARAKKFPASNRPSCSENASNAPTIENSNQAVSTAIVAAKPQSKKASWPPSFGPADLYQPMEDTVVPMFFNSYLYLPKDQYIRNGFMEILPANFSNTKPGSHLHVSTLAVAFFSVAAWTGQRSLLRASEHYFTQALTKIREALQKDEENDLDSVLLSTLLLSTYEEFVAMKDEEHPLKAHLRGAIALINNRTAKRLETPSSKTIDHAVQTQIIKTTRGLNSPMVPTPKVWPLSQPPAQPGPRPLLATAASEIVNLRHSWEQMIAQPPDQAVATSILAKATEIDTNLATWSYLLPPHWAPIAASIIPQSVRDAGMYNNRCDCYTDMWIATTWNTYRDCRILVQIIIIGCLRRVPFQDPNGLKVTLAMAIAHRLADDICASVPFCLGDQVESVRMKSGLVEYPFAETRPVTWTHMQIAPLMGAWFLAPYLRNLESSDIGLPSEQKAWVQSQIERILVIYFQR